MTRPPAVIRSLAAAEIESRRHALRTMLVDAIEGGACVGFVLPIDGKIDAYWSDVASSVATCSRQLFVAEYGEALVGSVQLAPCAKPNQPHRADVEKLLAVRAARRQGIGRALLDEVERAAIGAGRWLLTLDTRAGSEAEPPYPSLGWIEVGTIPDYAADRDRALAACTFYYKRLATGGEVSRSDVG